MNAYIPDPLEISSSRIERLCDDFIDESTCMGCGAKVDYELICMSPTGDGPVVCEECAGFKVADVMPAKEN